jgi:hypothetical protein
MDAGVGLFFFSVGDERAVLARLFLQEVAAIS